MGDNRGFEGGLVDCVAYTEGGLDWGVVGKTSSPLIL